MSWFTGKLTFTYQGKLYYHWVSTEEATTILEHLEVKQGFYEPSPTYWSI